MTKLFYGILSLCFFSASLLAQQLNTPINVIQGDGNLSPRSGVKVSTRGVVTAITGRGFFVQTPDAEADKNPNTSEGLYVFLGDEKVENLAVGNLVQVDGNVSEFQPRADRYMLRVTQISRPLVRIISKDNPLPAPMPITSTELDPNGKVDALEKYEGMRVKLDQITTTSPTGGRYDETAGRYESNGIFFGVMPGAPRPFREPGLDLLTHIIEKLPQTVPLYDMNPEIVRIDTKLQIGAEPVDVTSGATVKNITGVLDYSFRAYTVLVDPGAKPTVEGRKAFVPAVPAGEREVSVGSINIENFFDDEVNSPNVQNKFKLPKEMFEKRLAKTSLAIRKALAMPDLLGIIEVENLAVLKKLAAKINADEVAAGKPDPKYEAYLEEGNDIRGIDTGFLVKTTKIKVLETKQVGKEEKLLHSSAKPEDLLFDRPPFLVKVEAIDSKSTSPLTFTVMVNHFKSYGGIDDAEQGERTRHKRRLEAEWVAKFVEERQAANPDERMLVLGDFNAFQFNDGYNDLVGTLTGKQNQNVLVGTKQVYKTGLYNLIELIDPAMRYSYIFGGSAQTLDHILVNDAAGQRALKFGYTRLNADFPEVWKNYPNRPERISDHDAPIVYLSMDEVKAK